MRNWLWLLAVILSALGAAFSQNADQSVRFPGKVTDGTGARITVATVLVHPIDAHPVPRSLRSRGMTFALK
jgi:hypothetical protein